jgi:hypothetical protein
LIQILPDRVAFDREAARAIGTTAEFSALALNSIRLAPAMEAFVRPRSIQSAGDENMSESKKKTAKAVVSEQPARTTKIDTVLSMLKRPEGADARQLAQATGWQLHSVRGALSGHFKKKLGLKVTTEKVDGRTVYRVEA